MPARHVRKGPYQAKPNMKPDPVLYESFKKLEEADLQEIAWEFLRQNTEYQRAWADVTNRRRRKKSVCAEFGIVGLKDPIEGYATGKKPKFKASVRSYSFEVGAADRTQTKRVVLRPGEMALAFNTFMKMDTQFDFAMTQFKNRKREWELERPRGIPVKAVRVDQKGRENLARMLYVLEARRLKMTFNRINQVLFDGNPDPNQDFSRVEELHKRAKEFVHSGYQLLGLKGRVLGLNEPQQII